MHRKSLGAVQDVNRYEVKRRMDFDIAEFFIEVNYLRIGSKSSEVAIRVLSTIILACILI